MTTKGYKWSGGSVQLEWFEVEDECERLTGIEPADERDAVERLDRYYGNRHRVFYDEGEDWS